jgi:hypothetical protein
MLVNSNSWNPTGAILGAVGSAVGTAVINGIVQDVTYTVVTQIQVLTRNEPISPSASTSANTQAKYNYTQIWQTNQTNITTTADEVDLSVTKATPALLESIANSVASIF